MCGKLGRDGLPNMVSAELAGLNFPGVLAGNFTSPIEFMIPVVVGTGGKIGLLSSRFNSISYSKQSTRCVLHNQCWYLQWRLL